MTTDIWTWPESTIIRVIDGDTVVGSMTKDIDVDCGFHVMLVQSIATAQKLRLNRINASPAKTDVGKAATNYLGSLVMGIGNTVILETLKITGAYKFGDEWMVEITLADGTNVSDLMVSNGHAVYWDGEGPRPGG